MPATGTRGAADAGDEQRRRRAPPRRARSRRRSRPGGADDRAGDQHRPGAEAVAEPAGDGQHQPGADADGREDDAEARGPHAELVAQREVQGRQAELHERRRRLREQCEDEDRRAVRHDLNGSADHASAQSRECACHHRHMPMLDAGGILATRRLEAFLAVLEYGGFSRAAERLGVSQPTVSQLVQALERSVGTELLVRGRGAVRPTRGRDGAAPARRRRCWRSAERAAEAVQSADRDVRRHLRIAAGEALATHVLPPAVSRLRERLPGLVGDVRRRRRGARAGGAARRRGRRGAADGPHATRATSSRTPTRAGRLVLVAVAGRRPDDALGARWPGRPRRHDARGARPRHGQPPRAGGAAAPGRRRAAQPAGGVEPGGGQALRRGRPRRDRWCPRSRSSASSPRACWSSCRWTRTGSTTASCCAAAATSGSRRRSPRCWRSCGRASGSNSPPTRERSERRASPRPPGRGRPLRGWRLAGRDRYAV